MESSGKYCRLQANSILESVIALSIISVCLYIAMMVYANVFSPRTSAKAYVSSNSTDALFFLIQVQEDSISNNPDPNKIIEEEWLNTNLKKVTVQSKDSSGMRFEKQYFITVNNE